MAVTDSWESSIGGLFRLRREGVETAVTSYTDRNLPPEKQIHQLLAKDWLPEQHLARCADGILNNLHRAPHQIPDVNEGHVLAPSPAVLEALVSPETPVGPPELRPWLWPVVDSGGNILFEASENVVTEYAWAEPGHRFEYAGRDLHTYVTDKRYVVTASLDLPTSVRGDFKLPLALINPALMSAFAGAKAVSRIGQNAHRRWVKQLRWEWVSAVRKSTTTKQKHARKGGTTERTNFSFSAKVRMPDGSEDWFTLKKFEDLAAGPFRDEAKYLIDVAEYGAMLPRLMKGDWRPLAPVVTEGPRWKNITES